MGEVLFAVVVLLILISTIAALIGYLNGSGRKRKLLNSAPAVLLPPGEPPDVLLANARHSYALLQRAVRALDGLSHNTEAVAALSKDDIAEMRSIVASFYDR